MILSAHQPHYLPWLGYLDKIDICDVFVFLDDVQYKKNDWQNRNLIKTARGAQWLSVPVSFTLGQKICEVRVDNGRNWTKKHTAALITNYSRAPFFKEHGQFFEGLYSRRWDSLLDINMAIINYLLCAFGIGKRLLCSSSMEVSCEPTQRLIDLCKACGADAYLSGIDGGKYLDKERLQRAGIKLLFQDFRHPVYFQLFGEFLPNLSAVDLLFNCGPEAIKLLRQANGR